MSWGIFMPLMLSPFARRLLAAFALAYSLVMLPGCITTGAGAKARSATYARAELEANLDKDYSKVIEATRQAIKDLEFARISENKDALKAVLVARTGLDKKVQITLINSGKKLTNIKIGVGAFGDEQLSRLILAKIEAGL